MIDGLGVRSIGQPEPRARLASTINGLVNSAGVFVAVRLIGVEPEARPHPRTAWQFGASLEIPVALGKAGAVRVGRGEQTRAPFVVSPFARLDPQIAVAQGERKIRLRVGKGRIAEIAAPRGMSEPAPVILGVT